MNTTCLTGLVALKDKCAPGASPLFYLDDIEGMTVARLADLVTERDGTGKALATFLIESSVRLMLADIDSIMPVNYRIKKELMAICSSCTFSGFYNNAAPAGTGVLIKNTSNSRFTTIIVDSLKVRLNSSGNYTLRLIDKEGLSKDIVQAFVAGEELAIINIGFETTSKQVAIYFTDPAVELYTITCPANSSCGCGGGSTSPLTDIVIAGYANGIESTTQFGILPCVKIKCNYDDIICDLVQGSPRLFGLALLYLVASKAFEENVISQRVNRTASEDQDYKKTESEKYYALYRERLIGNPRKSILGISQAVTQNLKSIKDKCVTCDSPVGIAWAVG